MSDPTGSQRKLFDLIGWGGLRELVDLKSRQIRHSQTVAADNFYRLYTARSEYRIFVGTNHNDTNKILYGKYETFVRGLPERLKHLNPLKLNINERSVTSTRTLASIQHVTMGGTSQGRSGTFQRLVAEELAFWKNADSAFASVTNTLDDTCPIIIISTPNGPGGLYHRKVIQARRAMREWNEAENGRSPVQFMFSRWAEFPGYTRTPPDSWEPTHEEWELAQKHHLTIEQLYWRHERIHGVRGIGELHFRREFPLTEEDGFLILEGGWFDVDYLNDVYNSLPDAIQSPVRIYHTPSKTLRYAAGVDPSWCNGGDYAVCTILDENGRVCAVFSTNLGGEEAFARQAAELCRSYDAKVLDETNPGGAGKNVHKILRQEGCKLWTDPKNGKSWTTHHGNKEEAYADARQLVNGDAYELNDHATISELIHVREVDGRIGVHLGKDRAPTDDVEVTNDDHAMAFVLAGKCLQSLPTRAVHPRSDRRSYTRPRQAMAAVRSALP